MNNVDDGHVIFNVSIKLVCVAHNPPAGATHTGGPSQIAKELSPVHPRGGLSPEIQVPAASITSPATTVGTTGSVTARAERFRADC